MKNFKQSVFILLAVVVLSACKDDDSSEEMAQPTNTEQLTEKNFFVTDLNLTVDGNTAITYDDFDDCSKDDFTRFEKNGTAVDNEGATKCDPSDPQTDTYSWLFITDETKLQLDFGSGDIEVYNIITNDGTTLKLDQTSVEDFTGDGNDNTIITTITFTAR